MLKSYDRKLDQRLFSDIDLRYVRGFDMFLQKRGCCGNTRKFYFKALRAILNRANAEGIGSVATYPFGRGGFEVSNLEEATAKRYLPVAELSKLKSTTASNPQCEYARKLFLFSYYCYGISFIDMAPISNRWRTATISSTSGRRSSGRKGSNRFRSKSRPQSGN